MALEHTGKVLIVDREPHNHAVADLLQVGKFAAHFIERNGIGSALQAIRTLAPDAVLYNLDRPEDLTIADFMAVKAIQEYLPLIATVPPQAVALATTAFESGADEVLFKPLTVPEALPRIAAQIRHKQQTDALRARIQTLEDRLLQANAAAREIAVLKDSIVETVSHELRTPLLQAKSAISMIDSAARSAPEGSSMTVLLDFAKTSIGRLESVVQNISQLAGAIRVRPPEPFRVIDAVNIAMRQLTRSWTHNNHLHRVRVSADRVPLALGDKNAVGQVLFQLIDNGLKFSPNGEPVEVSAQAEGGQVRLLVRDSGIGLTEEEIAHIFDEFYQVDATSKRRFSGVGLGLAIVRLLIDNMSIQIEVSALPRMGSTFSFVLPIAPVTHRDVPNTGMLSQPGKVAPPPPESGDHG